MPLPFASERSGLNQFNRSKLQQRILGSSVTPSICNQVAHKIWFGHIGPSCQGRLANAGSSNCTHGKRYLVWDVVLTWDDGTYSGSLHSYGTIGKYSGSIIAAQTDITDTNPSSTGFHGPSTSIFCASITGISSSGEGNIHIDYNTNNGVDPNPPCSGYFEVNLSSVYSSADLQNDCRSLYLLRDISTLPDNSWRLLEWEQAANGQSQPSWLSGVYHNFFHGPCAGQPGTYAGLDPRTNWPVVNANWNGGAVPAWYLGPGYSAPSWTLAADYQTLIDTIDTTGYIAGNAQAQQFSGMDTGLWTMIGTVYRGNRRVKNCVKTTFSGTSFDTGSGTVISSVLSNPNSCANNDNIHNKPFNLYIDTPFITINDQNVEVDVTADPYFGKRKSDELDGSCDCVGKPSAPSTVSATPGPGTVVLTWSTIASDHVTHVDIYRAETSGAEAYLATWGGSTTYIDSLVASGHTYYYVLKAVNNFSESDFSVEVSATV